MTKRLQILLIVFAFSLTGLAGSTYFYLRNSGLISAQGAERFLTTSTTSTSTTTTLLP